ncbi:2'-5' RNA ligase family protein [Streptomyces sp. NPDC054796]
MRLFAALLPPDEATAALADAVGELRERDGAERLRWAPRVNWHITLAFYGEVDDASLPALRERLARVAARAAPLRLRCAGGGQFGGRALWAGVAAAEPEGADETGGTQGAGPLRLRRLAEASAAAGRKAGLPMEEPGRFRAHLTLARTRKGDGGPVDLTPYLRALDAVRCAPWTATELALVRSNLPVHGVPGEQPRYEQVEGWPLGR